ncbi:MAG: AAA family ATPase [Acidobacteria bacterium]|nr:AAA family ATPase [Acidobacteriota bacterium]
MLTRLRVSGFKNLLDVDLHFGPFTCIAGVDGAGKSNLFDAVRLLSDLAGHSLLDSAQSVRAAGRRAADVDSLFFRAGPEAVSKMSLAAEMIVPAQATDDLGQVAAPSITFVDYRLTLAKRQDAAASHLGPLEIVSEELNHINLGEAYKHLPFPHRAATWRKSAVTGSRRVPFISTEGEGGNQVVTLHQDGGAGGPRSVPARSLPRTVLSAADAGASPTALAARREMQSWRLLQLEPSSLREPDELLAPNSLAGNGAHLAATLHHLASAAGPEEFYRRVAARFAELLEEVRGVRVDADEKREILTLMVAGADGTAHAARALSEGVLRLLAFTVLAIDPRAGGLLCIENPEDGIHPARLPALLRLLQAIPTDVDRAVGRDNPLRQVIVNTHSPAVVSGVPDASLLIAAPRRVSRDARDGRDNAPAAESGAAAAGFRCLAGTWRAHLPPGGAGGAGAQGGGAGLGGERAQGAQGGEGLQPLSRGELLDQLRLSQRPLPGEPGGRPRRTARRQDPQPLLPYPDRSDRS